MEVSRTSAVERIARVLAGMRLSINGAGKDDSAGLQVDHAWQGHVDEAEAVLHALREPDARMAAVGDARTWTRMVRAALGEDVEPAGETKSWAGPGDETYQKPLG